MRHIIAAITELGPGLKEFILRPADRHLVPAWAPGSHIVLGFTDDAGRRFDHPYSLVGAPDAAPAYRIVVKREDEGKGGSRFLHEHLNAGDQIEVDGPHDQFPLQPASAAPCPRSVLIGAGIGITPLVSMAHALNAAGAEFTLHYLARSREQLILMDELRALPYARIHVHLSQDSGRVDLRQLLGSHGVGDSCYACGPAGLLQALAQAAALNGWPADALHVESFGARRQGSDAPLVVELALSGKTIDVMPGTSILDALIAEDAFVAYDCRRGECGHCYTRVLGGTPLHRDVCLTPGMRAQGMCTCVSWAAAPERLVLEL